MPNFPKHPKTPKPSFVPPGQNPHGAAVLSLHEALYIAAEAIESFAGDDFDGRVTFNYDAGRFRSGEVLVVEKREGRPKKKTSVELERNQLHRRPLADTGAAALDCRRKRRSGVRR